MNVKAVITLILGLVFQLAQALPAATFTSPCASQGTFCACCESADSCPCAENVESDQKPAPQLPESGNVLKLPATKADDNRFSIESRAGALPSPTLAASPVSGPSSGYAGVPLAVAFCSFVI
jgi:hypothetical protein